MGEDDLAANLANGLDDKPGIGEEKAARFFADELVARLLSARKLQLKQITKQGATDGFGRHYEVNNETLHTRY